MVFLFFLFFLVLAVTCRTYWYFFVLIFIENHVPMVPRPLCLLAEDHETAQLEMLMIAHAQLARLEECRSRHGVSMINNVAGLRCLIRGAVIAQSWRRTLPCGSLQVEGFAVLGIYPSKAKWAAPIFRTGPQTLGISK